MDQHIENAKPSELKPSQHSFDAVFMLWKALLLTSLRCQTSASLCLKTSYHQRISLVISAKRQSSRPQTRNSVKIFWGPF